MTSPSPSTPPPPDDLEWEEWDASTSPLSFSCHCLAGSFAGVAEHTLLYPLDTVKTCWQSQVLHRARGGGAPGCGEPCAAGEATASLAKSLRGAAEPVIYNPLSLAAPELMSSTKFSSNVNGNPSTNSSGSQNQGILSTMKNLMRKGHHHHSHPINQQFSHAHVYTLAGNPPNVVDLTANTTAAAALESNNIGAVSTTTNNTKQRPWSKQSRMLRNATIQDITAHGMIRTANTDSSTAIINPNTAHNNAGFKRLWRGVQTMFVGCVPAHALYFSSYEAIKGFYTNNHQSSGNGNNHVGHDTLSPGQAMLAGGTATLLHDFVMTPMDTMKQRMQLGHYDSLRHAFVSIVWGDHRSAMGGQTVEVGSGSGSGTGVMRAAAGEGWRGLYRSFPITVATNVPYGMIMMTTNEWLRASLEDGLYGLHSPDYHEESPFHFATILLSGMGAGAIASAITAPLDRVKTRLQTQRLGMVLPGGVFEQASSGAATAGGAILEERALAAARGEPKVCPKVAVRNAKRALFSSAAGPVLSSLLPPPTTATTTPFTLHYATPLEACRSILREEGPRGLFRGTLPRVALHAPSVAISWTAYEMAKDWLMWFQ